MYLARVEMTGFKSFADKTVIEFDQGLTAVVGPNGSGKSNLSEAIRWVLGEQSAKSLRGSKMEDVIFNGTQDRKSVNLAKVTLVLNNEDRYLDYDFSEISITRSYNRNGESFYYINNEQVRLKDIVDLLMDSGLGKNSFAMISQGKVESIFLSKPEERRAIFEEAAGVQKYQYRKTEAERKLNKSKDHLSRVRDIIHEISGQLKPLKRQHDTAVTYQTLSAELQNLDIGYTAYKINEDRNKWSKKTDQLTEIQALIKQSIDQRQALQEKLLFQQASFDQLVAKIDQDSLDIQELGQLLEQQKGRLMVKNQELSYSQSSAKDRQDYYQQQEVALKTSQNQKDILEERLHLLKLEIQQDQSQLSNLQDQRKNLQGLSMEDIESLRNQMIQYYQEEAKVNNQIGHTHQVLDQAQKRLERLEDQSSQEAKTDGGLGRQYQDQTLIVKQLEQKVIQTQVYLDQVISRWKTLQEDKAKLQKSIYEFDRQSNQMTNQLHSLQRMQSDYEGYYGGVKAVMRAKEQIGGIFGTVAELLQVPDSYQIAIDTALGGSLQHIVVESDSAAKRGIELLKSQRAGRATFLPISNIKGRHINQDYLIKAREVEGFVGLANDLVTHDQQFYTLFKQLLGTTIIMEDIDRAQGLARQLNFQAKIVTIDGELLMPGGAITGGRQKHQGPSMLSRQHEISGLKAKIKELTARQQQTQADWDQVLQAEQNLQAEGESAREKNNQAQIELKASQADLSLLERQTNLEQAGRIQIQKEITSIRGDVQDYKANLESLQLNLEDIQTKIQKGLQILDQENMNQSQRQETLVELDQKIGDLTTRLAVKEVEEKQLKGELLQVLETLDHLGQALANFELNQSNQTMDMNKLKLEIEKLQETIREQEVVFTEKNQQVSHNKEERQALQVSIRQMDQQLQEIQSTLNSYEREEVKLQGHLERLNEQIDQQLDYLTTTYQVTFEAAFQEGQQIDDLQGVGQKVKQLKQAIDQLGPVNIEAIESYQELNQRFVFLTEQESDLLVAMEDLQATMDEMDSEVKVRFSQTFESINQQFQKTFKSLFGGGFATLELTDPENLLTTGVDIVAQPPGKRKQNLALLSGGERAFTAIALLFAILETKPVPFCILDEVEAALDDANVWRYGEYLQHFTQSTQFIVITHRKGTMEHADVLYGVTMEKSGISKLASVRLSQASTLSD